MPHIIIETSQNVVLNQPDELLNAINTKLWQTGKFSKKNDIKSRIYHANHSLVGLLPSDEKFISVHFYLMKGRDDATKALLVKVIYEAIDNHISQIEKTPTHQSLQITINAMELGESYLKQII